MKLGEYVAQYRAEHGLSQRQFAALSGLSNGYIAMLEKDVNPSTGKPIVPSMDRMRAIATTTGKSLTELLELLDDMEIDLGCSQSVQITDEELRLVELYRKLDDRGKAAVMHVAEYESNR